MRALWVCVEYSTPFAFGSAVFVVIGFYLMNIGVTKPLAPT